MTLSVLRVSRSLAASMVVVGVLISACSEKKKNADILTQSQMVERLSDIYILEQKNQRINLPPDSAAAVFNKMKDKFFEHAKISDSVFRQSFDYYVDRPEELEQIYTAVIDTLNLREQRMEMATSNPK